jgi:hypothetical protein
VGKIMEGRFFSVHLRMRMRCKANSKEKKAWKRKLFSPTIAPLCECWRIKLRICLLFNRKLGAIEDV